MDTIMPQDGNLKGASYLRLPVTDQKLRQELLLTALAGDDAKLKEKCPPDSWVVAGETIWSYEMEIPGVPGRNEKGEELVPLPSSHAIPKTDGTLSLHQRELLALCDGVLTFNNGVLRIVAEDALPRITLDVSAQALRATITVVPNRFQTALLSRDLIDSILKQKNIPEKYNAVALEEGIQRYNQGKRPLSIKLLEGKRPVPGSAGGIKLLHSLNPKISSKEEPNKIDFKNVNVFVSVKLGEPVGEIIQPTPGVAGQDIFGNPIVPEPTSPWNGILGANTELDPVDSNKILASCDGHLLCTEGLPVVDPTLRIENDLDYHEGNVKFDGPVSVKGNVRSGVQY